ncbi:MAG: hypothetical protein JXM70_13785 [Pirellulales bacterium]|nr:hypothetical protein [Pirellulales bacterium]
MSLEQAIHQRWADSSDLCALLPGERFTTGRAAGGEKPFATMQVIRRQPTLPTNAGNTVEEVLLELCLRHDDFDIGEQIIEYIQAIYDRSTFNLPDDSAVVRMREVSMSATHEKDGDWQWKVELMARICVPLDD